MNSVKHMRDKLVDVAYDHLENYDTHVWHVSGNTKHHDSRFYLINSLTGEVIRVDLTQVREPVHIEPFEEDPE